MNRVFENEHVAVFVDEWSGEVSVRHMGNFKHRVTIKPTEDNLELNLLPNLSLKPVAPQRYQTVETK